MKNLILKVIDGQSRMIALARLSQKYDKHLLSILRAIMLDMTTEWVRNTLLRTVKRLR